MRGKECEKEYERKCPYSFCCRAGVHLPPHYYIYTVYNGGSKPPPYDLSASKICFMAGTPYGAPSGIRTRDPMQHSPQAKLRVILTLKKDKKESHSSFCVHIFRRLLPAEIASFASKTSPSGIRTRDPMQHSPHGEMKSHFDSEENKKRKPFKFLVHLQGFEPGTH